MTLTRGADALLPTRHGDFRVIAYRDDFTAHLALVATTDPAATPLVRVHSECLTGDVLGSQRCDCGDQLDESLERIAAVGGVVVYLRGHEGRGIGLLNKIEAYALQDAGRDTVDANTDLGLPVDARNYATAAAMLLDLGYDRIDLLTNNPHKPESLATHGVEVVERVPIDLPSNPHNIVYLTTKRDRMGHLLENI